jgi:uncharacterized protein YdeI (BOF family)
MKTTIVLAVLLAATPAFAASSYGYGQGSPGATMQDYKMGPHHQRATKKPAKPLHMQAAPTQKQKQAAPTQKPAK